MRRTGKLEEVGTQAHQSTKPCPLINYLVLCKSYLVIVVRLTMVDMCSPHIPMFNAQLYNVHFLGYDDCYYRVTYSSDSSIAYRVPEKKLFC